MVDGNITMNELNFIPHIYLMNLTSGKVIDPKKIENLITIVFIEELWGVKGDAYLPVDEPKIYPVTKCSDSGAAFVKNVEMAKKAI